MPYVERVTKAGNTIEIERYFTSRYKKKGISRGDKVKPTKEEQEKVNTRQAERKLRILINATAVITLTPEEYASWNGWHKVKGKMKKAYRNGSFVMNQSTFDTGIDGMEDKNGQPIGRTNYGVNGEETYRFMGKNVETVEDDVLPSWDDANEGDVIAVFMNFSDYVINTNMEMQVVKWTDHDNNKIKNKCLMVVDGKVADAAGIILVKKGVTAV